MRERENTEPKYNKPSLDSKIQIIITIQISELLGSIHKGGGGGREREREYNSNRSTNRKRIQRAVHSIPFYKQNQSLFRGITIHEGKQQ